MDDCKRLKDLILTDYVDGQLDESTKNEIESHLSSCEECRRFSQEVEKTLIGPFRTLPRQQVPDRIWTAIQERLEENQVENKGESFWERWLVPLLNPKFAPVLAVIVLLVLSGTLTFYNLESSKETKTNGSEEYLTYLISSVDIESTSADTPIEQYFL